MIRNQLFATTPAPRLPNLTSCEPHHLSSKYVAPVQAQFVVPLFHYINQSMRHLLPWIFKSFSPFHLLQNLARATTARPVHRVTKSTSQQPFSSMAPTGIKNYDYVVIGGGSGGSGYADTG